MGVISTHSLPIEPASKANQLSQSGLTNSLAMSQSLPLSDGKLPRFNHSPAAKAPLETVLALRFPD